MNDVSNLKCNSITAIDNSNIALLLYKSNIINFKDCNKEKLINPLLNSSRLTFCQLTYPYVLITMQYSAVEKIIKKNHTLNISR